jgi:hypothetical protein
MRLGFVTGFWFVVLGLSPYGGRELASKDKLLAFVERKPVDVRRHRTQGVKRDIRGASLSKPARIDKQSRNVIWN